MQVHECSHTTKNHSSQNISNAKSRNLRLRLNSCSHVYACRYRTNAREQHSHCGVPSAWPQISIYGMHTCASQEGRYCVLVFRSALSTEATMVTATQNLLNGYTEVGTTLGFPSCSRCWRLKNLWKKLNITKDAVLIFVCRLKKIGNTHI